MGGYSRVDKKSFGMTAPRETVGQLRILTKRMNYYLADYGDEEPLKDVDLNDLNEALYRSQLFSNSCRYAMEKSEKTFASAEDFNSVTPSEDIPDSVVSVSFDGHILRIHTPFTFFRFTKSAHDPRNYQVIIPIRAALIKWQKENNFDLHGALTPPLTSAIIRHSVDDNPGRLCDNDNMENGRIINEIANALGVSDNPFVMDLISAVRKETDGQKQGMEFLFFERREIRRYIDELF